MATIRKVLAFWWRCACIAAGYGTAFSNNWQWVWGVPAGVGALAGVASWQGGLFESNPVLYSFALGLLAFVLTWPIPFLVRMLVVPTQLVDEATQRADRLQAQLDGVEIEHDRIQAMRDQTEEMRLDRIQRQRAADPFLQAMNDAAKQAFASGAPLKEMPLGFVVHWVATCTSWGRWQSAQTGLSQDGQQLLRLTESHITSLLSGGELRARGRRAGSAHREIISPDWWGQVYAELVADNAAIYKASIRPRHGVEEAVAAEFTEISCDWAQIESIFPREVPAIDAMTAAILAKQNAPTAAA
jgi:hypothetical protein